MVGWSLDPSIDVVSDRCEPLPDQAKKPIGRGMTEWGEWLHSQQVPYHRICVVHNLLDGRSARIEAQSRRRCGIRQSSYGRLKGRRVDTPSGD